MNPIEKSYCFCRTKTNFGLTQEQIAIKVGQDRSTIANTIRLLDLPEEIQGYVSRGTISMGHARSLLSLKDASKQKALSERIEGEGLSVRDVELIVSGKKNLEAQKKDDKGVQPASVMIKSPQVLDLEDGLRRAVGAKVTIKEKNGKGKITIEFSNNAQFEIS